eukprot:CAMPEP_0202690124 /NCGR_PEP_ID=MMETSP1385-20130828/5223_1 /ASSEMBLY_ACC=CAM_ASM_000861 /TAXON_ID=933848 /ORGANISM="Elphidium margaritaceum" /LENGTH=282 /DNA_ID=CAMNT_0049345355 /DNA_START=47 /DNA_END=895 /DNA_ORIENTATION=+
MGCCSAKANAQGTYDPSPFTRLVGTSSSTKYVQQTYEQTYSGQKRILVVCTDEGEMKMTNGKTFNTGNHPVEMLVPMLHFRDAGFSFDIATANGGPVVLEMWAYPNKDANVASIHDEVRAMMEKPKKLDEIPDLDSYTAIFIPGGHGCMLNLPQSVALGKLLNQAHERSMPTVTLCHGPSVFLSTCVDGTGQSECAYKGYKSMCFTDKTDAFTPSVGYLPGPMPWKVQESIVAKGVIVINEKETGAVTYDRELITGDSPDAGHNLGVLAAPMLVKYALENNL